MIQVMSLTGDVSRKFTIRGNSKRSTLCGMLYVQSFYV